MAEGSVLLKIEGRGGWLCEEEAGGGNMAQEDVCKGGPFRAEILGMLHMWDLGAQGGSAKALVRNNALGGSMACVTRAWRKRALLSSETV